MKKVFILVLLIFVALIVYQYRTQSVDTMGVKESKADTLEELSLSLSSVEQVMDYPDAMLELYQPSDGQSLNKGKVDFTFNVKNFIFGAQQANGLKISLNGQAPKLYRNTEVQLSLSEGQYTLFAYLTDQNGIGLKEYGNYLARDFAVGVPAQPLSTPILIINLPEDGAVISPNQSFIIDAYTARDELASGDVLLEVQVGSQRLVMTGHAPYQLDGLPVGEYEISFRLLNTRQEPIVGDYAATKRRISIR